MTKLDLSRHIPFEGVSNFRDLGGYRTHDNHRLRWHKLYRSDRLSDFTPDDLQRFSQLGVARSIDLRGTAEAEASHYSIPNLQRIAIPIEPKIVQSLPGLLAAGSTLDAAKAHQLMKQTYAAFVHSNALQYRHFFDVLLSDGLSGAAGVVFHCTAGKDRTGFAAALLLELLGVDRNTIMHDYLLTNDFYKPMAKPSTELPAEVLDVLWRVAPDFLEASYHEIDNDYGGVAHFLQQHIGLDAQARSALKERFLEPIA